MKRKTRRTPCIIGISLLLAILMVAGATFASASGVSILSNTPPMESVHEKLDISEITGEIVEPPQLTSAASAIAAEKAWYEYVYYSSEPVAYYYLDDNTRLSFYDPYNYAESLVMEVEDNITDWSSNNTLQISYTTGNSISSTEGKNSDTKTTVQVVAGQDVSYTEKKASTVTTTVDGKIETYNYGKTGETTQSQERLSKEQLWDPSSFNEGTIIIGSKQSVGLTGAEIELEESATFRWQGDSKTNTADIKDYDGESFSDYSRGYTENNQTTTATTTGGDSEVKTTIADRISTAVGTAASTSIALSTNNSTTITKTYSAGYFNASGAPLQWKIVKYTVKMPMKYQLEYLIDDEWVFSDYSYCLLTTIQGTCRAWLQNNVAYYEHWGTGEPVTWDEFWAQFFTEDSLIAAYKNRLYPDN